MDRKDFLRTVGLGAAAVACVRCLGGCNPNDVPTAPTNVNFTLNLNDPANAALKNNGGYIYSNSIIVARLNSGAYAALSQVCTHAGGTVYYDSGTNRFFCPNHGSNFATDGSVINGPAGGPLQKYNTSLSGTTLRVYS